MNSDGRCRWLSSGELPATLMSLNVPYTSALTLDYDTYDRACDDFRSCKRKRQCSHEDAKAWIGQARNHDRSRLVHCLKDLLCMMPFLGVVSADIEPISRLRLTGPSNWKEGWCMRIKRLKEISQLFIRSLG